MPSITDQRNIPFFHQAGTLELSGQKTPEDETPIATQVGRLEHSLICYKELCLEIVTTLTLDGNKTWFVSMPEDWHLLVQEWQERLESLGDS